LRSLRDWHRRAAPQNTAPITVRYLSKKYVKDVLKTLAEAEKRLQKKRDNILENTEYRVLTLASGGPKYDPGNK
jgi:hypothetical protein